MHEVFPTPDGVDLEIHIPAGTIEVSNEERADTVVEITGERDPDDLRIERMDRSAGRPLIRIEHRSRRMFGSSRDLRVRVQAPTQAVVEASTGSADLVVRGEAAAIASRSGSGAVEFDRVAGDVAIGVASGDVRGERVDGNLVVNSASGDVEVGSVGRGATANTASGDLAIGSVGGSVTANSASGDVLIGAFGTGSVHARTMSGDVMVGVVEGTRVWLDLSSVSGETVSELDAADGSGIGETAELHLSSVSGDIRVHRAPIPAREAQA